MSGPEDDAKARREAERRLLEHAAQLLNSRQVIYLEGSFLSASTVRRIETTNYDVVIASHHSTRLIETKFTLPQRPLAETPPSEPPQILQRILWALLPARDREPVLGDALEAYHQTLDRFGSRMFASYDYAKEVLYAVIGSAWRRLIQIIALLRRGR